MTIGSVQSEVEAHLAAAARLYRELNLSRPTRRRLGDQEMRVAVLYALTQMTAAGIGDDLGITESTVKTVMRRIFRKLQIRSRAELPAALARVGDVA